jgi:UTP:GlnB (protein PII) uridylyltransferase
MPATAPLFDALTGSGAADRLYELDAGGHLTRAIPELDEGRGFKQPNLHYYTVLDHNLAAVRAFDEAVYGSGADELRAALGWTDLDETLALQIDGLGLPVLTRLACLVHDVAKPRTATVAEDRLRFPRHGPEGAEMMAARLPEIGLGPAAVRFVTRMVRYHLRPADLVRNRPVTDRAWAKFSRDLDGMVLPLMLVNLADGWATRGPTYTREHFRRHVAFVNFVTGSCTGLGEDHSRAVTRPG